jgi:ribonuclease HI
MAQPPQRAGGQQGSLWERLLEATQRHQEVLWRKVKGHSKTGGAHKSAWWYASRVRVRF